MENTARRLIACAALALVSQAPLFATGQAATTTAEAAPLEVISRTFIDVYDENDVLDLLQEKLGFEISWTRKSSSDYREQQLVVLASGDYPDVMEFLWSDIFKDVRQNAEDGVFRPLNDLLAQYGQNILAARPYDEQWYKPLDDGEVYSIPTRFNSWLAEHALLVRTDWLRNLGLSVPTNLDELYTVLHAFTNDDPDQDGQKDTFGSDCVSIISGRQTGWRCDLNRIIATAFGVNPSHGGGTAWEVIDGELVNWLVNPAYLDVVKYERRLYQEGLIDPEFAIMTRPNRLDKIYAGTYGVHRWPFTHLDSTSSWWTGLTNGNPGMEFAWIEPFVDPQGRRRHLEMSIHTGSFQSSVFADSEQPENAIKLIDFLATEEGALLASYGQEGVHYRYEGPNLIVSEMTEDERKSSGAYVYSWFFRKTNVLPINEYHADIVANYLQFVEPKLSFPPLPAGVRYGAGLQDLVLNRITTIITAADIDVDAEYAALVAEWLDKGGREITDEVNEYYQTVN